MLNYTKIFPEVNPVIREDLENIIKAKLPWELLRKKTILVAGGAGFLAAYLIKSLLLASRLKGLNIRIICIIRRAQSAEVRFSNYFGASDFSIFQHDITRPLPNDFPRADFIIHSASQASPQYYGVDPIGTLLPNSTGTMHLLNHAIRSKTEKFLFFSSGEIYGIPVNPDRLVGEKDYGYLDPLTVRSSYAESKRIGETMSAAWAEHHGLHTCIVRPFHTYGPGMALDDGRVFADFVADVVAKRDIVLNSDGGAKRSFCYLADATIGFLTVLLLGAKAEAYNVGNPDAELSIGELATVLSELFPERGVATRFKALEISNKYLQSPISRCCPAIDKIRHLGWFPTTGVKEGFRRTIQSFL